MILASAQVMDSFTQNLKFLDSLPNLLFAFFVFVLFYFASKFVSRLANKFNLSKNKQLLSITVKLIKWSIIGIGILVSLGVAGISVGSLVAGLGLTGAGMALALKDALSNFIAGIMILLNKPFKVGDNISVREVSGVVYKIETRYTVLKSGNKKHIIPNSFLYTNPVTITLEPKK